MCSPTPTRRRNEDVPPVQPPDRAPPVDEASSPMPLSRGRIARRRELERCDTKSIEVAGLSLRGVEESRHRTEAVPIPKSVAGSRSCVLESGALVRSSTPSTRMRTHPDKPADRSGEVEPDARGHRHE